MLTERLLTLESEPPARRFGRVFVGTPQQARGRSFRVVFVPGLAERMFPQKPREDPLLLDDAANAALDAALPTQRAPARGRAAAAAAGGRRRVRAAVRLVSAHRAERIARARAVVLRARRDARRHRPRAGSRVARGAGARRRQRHAGLAGAAASRGRHRRPGARPRRAAAAARRAGSSGGQGPRALPAQAERVPAALGHRPLGARPAAMVAERRPDARVAADRARRSPRSG